ncbi:carboxylesterase/lipase family protein [Thermodesulfobacteriota bacterium]
MKLPSNNFLTEIQPTFRLGMTGLLLIFILMSCSFVMAKNVSVVETSSGKVKGTPKGDVMEFLGIPYAAPPTGDLRWKPPEQPQAWSGVRDATRFGNACAQFGSEGMKGSEDCLTLNVWTPDTESDAMLPVMFFLHAGDNIIDATSHPLYYGRWLAERGHADRDHAVVVTANYRLGAFGFLAHPAFKKENQHGSTGNYALMDQIAALKWVKNNITVFGGDPNRVLLFGLSAGSVDTCALLASPLAKGLFSRALMQSGPCVTMVPGAADNTADVATDFLGCKNAPDVAACLRAVDAGRVAQVPGAGRSSSLEACVKKGCDFNPTVDGYVLPDTPHNLIRKGRHNHVPVIIGTTADEYSIFFSKKDIETESDYRKKVWEWTGTPGNFFGKQGIDQFILEHYPLSDYPSPLQAFVKSINDIMHTCPARRTLRALAESQTEPVWRYQWTYRFPEEPLSRLCAFHGSDLDFVFGTFTRIPIRWNDFVSSDWGRAQLKLSSQVMGYWRRFADTGNPNGAGAPKWPEFDPKLDTYLQLGNDIEAKEGVETDMCDLQDKLDLSW